MSSFRINGLDLDFRLSSEKSNEYMRTLHEIESKIFSTDFKRNTLEDYEINFSENQKDDTGLKLNVLFEDNKIAPTQAQDEQLNGNTKQSINKIDTLSNIFENKISLSTTVQEHERLKKATVSTNSTLISFPIHNLEGEKNIFKDSSCIDNTNECVKKDYKNGFIAQILFTSKLCINQ